MITTSTPEFPSASPMSLAPVSVDKRPAVDHPIHELLARRWSPYGFTDQPVASADLCSLFEAARWAASSYNEQPWIYLVATRDSPDEFERLLSCLEPPNQVWAKAVPVLALGVVRKTFARNHQENRAAVHDLGLASASLVLEATSRGLAVHQMIGILPDRARELYAIPSYAEALTGLAIGYRAESDGLPPGLRDRDQARRQRNPLNQFVFTGAWGKPAALGRAQVA